MSCILTLPGGQRITLAEESGFSDFMRGTVEPALAAARTEAEVPLSGGGSLHAESYLLPGAKQSVILLHGYTESAEKFREMAWYFLQAGFSVFSYDHRGHGRSLRQLEDLSVTHVDYFQEYVNDLEEFILRVVRPAMGDAPMNLYAHSMGGAVAAHFLIRHPDTFRRAVLSSPMIAPSANPYPLWVGKAMAGAFCLIGKGKSRAFIGGPFDPEKETFEASCDTSRPRFDYYQAKRNGTPYLQNCSPTYNWVYQAADQTKELLKEKNTRAVKTEVLLCQAGLDTVVLLPPQDKFVSLLPHATLKRYEAAKHEIYNSTDDVVREYVQDVLAFLLKNQGGLN